ncbi:MAG: GGDEF domain-containing protein [Gammaproteobacteria bacterium]|nr:GGDEF domain-containing protein [Gammaproteobacteria bacterium]MBU1623876.1 GGDEF domain-containing protein [Gammaproteobacteria bacterium]MBU1982093.1 GGDEF domain-containing protein [Gammaproteobacteria bacterium]
MHLNKKVTLSSLALAAVMIAVLIVVSLLSFRQFSIMSAQSQVRTAAEIVRVSLTEDMINGVIGQREGLLRRLGEVPGLQSVHVTRGDNVVQQFGPGMKGEHAADDVETRVLQNGEAFFAVLDESTEPVFRGTIPFVASRSGTPNCLQCHDVADGAVLGAVTVTMSIGHLKDDALFVSAIMVLAVAFFMMLMLFLLRRLVKPMITTAQDVQDAVSHAIRGDFHANIQQRTNDEIGQVAQDVNKLMRFLHKGLSEIRQDIAQLLKHKPPEQDGNLLDTTVEMVQGLIDAAQFKQSIEEDESKTEIYQRLALAVRERFGLSHFSLYEVQANKNLMVPVTVDGEFGAPCRWCDPQILLRSETCRARRTGHLIDSIETPTICFAFRPPQDGGEYHHVCFPIMQSGAVGGVLQLMFATSDTARMQEIIPYLSVYLREAAPVLEAKRLMDTLRESTLRDAMTGLHNRRFLEEYTETLVSATQRRKSEMSILMLDLDYFKMVNDTHGHDAGDTVLKAIAKVMTQSVRTSDMVIRYGGEEFLIILQDTDSEGAALAAEKIRAAVEALKIQLTGTILQKTISIGISVFPTDGDTFWQVVKYADVALYNAKESGRNRVVRFTPELWTDEKTY